MARANDNIIWKDRKRYLGMPLSFTRYSLSEDRLFLSVGFINLRDEEVLLYPSLWMDIGLCHHRLSSDFLPKPPSLQLDVSQSCHPCIFLGFS